MRTRAGWKIAISAVFAVLAAASSKGVSAAATGTLERIAFTSNRSGTAQIYVMNADGSGQTRLTNSAPFDDMQPAWSPDGTRIAFSRGTSYQSANLGSSSIVVMDSSGGNEQVLAAETGINFRPAWSPDGQRILYIHGSPTQAPFDVWVMNADGTDKHAVNTNGVTNPAAWSPDGSRIVFGRTAPLEIWVMNADGTGETRLTTTVPNYTPNWAPSNRIVFTSARDGGAKQVYVMDPDGTNQTRLADDGAENKFPTWSPDGSRIAYSRSTVPCVGAECSSTQLGGYEIYVMNADGSGQTRITNTTPPGREFGDGYPAYAPRVSSAADPGAQSLAVAPAGQILPATGSTQLPVAFSAVLLVAGGSALLRTGKSRRHKIP